MKAVVALLVLAIAAPARAERLDRVVSLLAGEDLPAGLGVAQVQLAADVAAREVAPDDVTIAWPSAPHAGRVNARVTIRGAHGKRLWAAVTLAPEADVAVATRALAVGDVIGAADVTHERRAAASRGPAIVVGARVTAAIAAGDVIDARAIELPPPVARGAEVTVQIRRGALCVHARGTLDRPGRIGDDAAVRLANHTLVHGTLVDASTVEIGAAP
jgi:flagella basal body P-ring formation protein FlgA